MGRSVAVIKSALELAPDTGTIQVKSIPTEVGAKLASFLHNLLLLQKLEPASHYRLDDRVNSLEMERLRTQQIQLPKNN